MLLTANAGGTLGQTALGLGMGCFQGLHGSLVSSLRSIPEVRILLGAVWPAYAGYLKSSVPSEHSRVLWRATEDSNSRVIRPVAHGVASCAAEAGGIGSTRNWPLAPRGSLEVRQHGGFPPWHVYLLAICTVSTQPCAQGDPSSPLYVSWRRLSPFSQTLETEDVGLGLTKIWV